MRPSPGLIVGLALSVVTCACGRDPHIDDADPRKPLGTQTDADRVMPGDGCLDLKSEIRLLKEKGYDGAVSLELFNRDLWEKDPGEVLKRGVERVRALVE